MILNRQENGLKGLHNLAQGKRSVALGWKTDMKSVRGIRFIKAKILFRMNEMILFFPEILSNNSYNSLRGFRKLNSVRRELFTLFIEFTRTVFLLYPIPRAAFRIVPPETLPYAMIFWPFRPEGNFDIDLFIKSSRGRGEWTNGLRK